MADPLPTASLDDVAAQIRKDFAAQTSGGTCCDEHEQEAAPPPPPVPAKKRISQETFDDVVKENVDEFDMTAEEAMRDAVEQFTSQGVDLSGLVTSPAEKEVDERMAAAVDKLNEALKDPACTGEVLVAELDELARACSAGSTERAAAGRHGAVGAATFVCKKHMEDKPACVAALRLLAALAEAPENREIIPFQGVEAVTNCLKHHVDCPLVQSSGFSAVSQAVSKHEGNKRNFKDTDINSHLLATLRAHAGDPQVVPSACRFLRIYLSDDDRRPGVQPGTFSRARELGEDYERGVLQPLINLLSQQDTVANDKLTTTTMATLKTVAVNDLICKHIASKGGLEAALVAFEAHITDETVAANGCMLLKAVSRNDDIKRIVGKGKGLGLVLRALDEHDQSPKVAEQALQCLSVLCLRQPENCETIAGLGCLQMIVSAMQRHPDVGSVQRPAISTLRNMVSSWQNKDLAGKILDEGAEPLIRKARAEHPICEEVAFAALRDLGCDYHA